MKKQKKHYPLVRFDWAMKKLLRQKANFDILEGFLSELLKEKVRITRVLESESNKEAETDKYNRVDIFVENEKGELLIIEIQNTQEYDYFHRILYGVSKTITEHISQGDSYAKVKKVISITIAYFPLGDGKDYLYHGTTNFIGVHKKDRLELSPKQRQLYGVSTPADLFPEYWLLKIGNFKDKLKETFDQWMYFLKNAEVLESFTAQGLPEAKEKLDEMRLPEAERQAYQFYKRFLRDRVSEEYNKQVAMEERLEQLDAVKAMVAKGIAKGIEEGAAQERAKAESEKEQMILDMAAEGFSAQQIAKITQKPLDEVQAILAKNKWHYFFVNTTVFAIMQISSHHFIEQLN